MDDSPATNQLAEPPQQVAQPTLSSQPPVAPTAVPNHIPVPPSIESSIPPVTGPADIDDIQEFNNRLLYEDLATLDVSGQTEPSSSEPSAESVSELPELPPPSLSAPNPNQPPLKPYSPDAGLSLHAAQYSKTLPSVVVPAQRPGTALPVTAEGDAGETSTPAVTDPDLISYHEPAWKTGFKAACIFALTFAIVFGILEGPALYARAKYVFSHLGKQAAPVQIAYLPKLQDRPVSLSELKNNPDDFAPRERTFGQYTLADIGDNELLIPKIDAKAPIVWGSDSAEATMLANLQKGVVHYGFTAYPDQGAGKVFISGHSSYNLWDPGRYKTIFANLDKLETGDQMAVTYKGLVYIYQVETTAVVKPSQVEVLNQTNEPTLSLMTCVPVGTSLNRLVVTAKLVSATPNTPVELPPLGITDPASIFAYLPAF